MVVKINNNNEFNRISKSYLRKTQRFLNRSNVTYVNIKIDLRYQITLLGKGKK